MKLSLTLVNIVSVFLIFFSARGIAASFPLSSASGIVEFLAIGRPSAIKIKGKSEFRAKAGDPLSGNLVMDKDRCTGKARFKLETFTTGISLRDSHMKEKYLEVAQYPFAELEITKLEHPELLSESRSLRDIPFEGRLSLHGKTNPVLGSANFEKKSGVVSLRLDFNVNVTDYGIPIPSYMGIKVVDAVAVHMEASGPLKETTVP